MKTPYDHGRGLNYSGSEFGETETPAAYSGSNPNTQGFDVSTLTRTAFMSGQP